MPEPDKMQPGRSSLAHDASSSALSGVGPGPGKRTLVEQLPQGEGAARNVQVVRVKNHKQIPADQDAELVQISGGRYQVSWDGRKFWVEKKDVEERGTPSTPPAQATSSQRSGASQSVAPPELAPAQDVEPPTTARAKPPVPSKPPGLQVSQPSSSTVTAPDDQAIAPAPALTAPALAEPTSTSQQATPGPSAAVSSGSGGSSLRPGLPELIEKVYADNGRHPTAAHFVEALQAFTGGDAEAVINDPQFAWELMRIVGEASGKNLHQQIVQAKGSRLQYNRAAVYSMPWTLRHYTSSRNQAKQVVPPGYTKLKSTLELTVSQITKSENTNDSDWADIGNVGFSFYLLCVNGQAPKRSFLSTCTHYAEFDFESIPSMFVSGDMLGAAKGEKKQPGLRGSGTEVKQGLCSEAGIDRSNPAAFLSGLDSHFGNFEVKVPGQLIVSQWNPL